MCKKDCTHCEEMIQCISCDNILCHPNGYDCKIDEHYNMVDGVECLDCYKKGAS